MLDRLRIVDFKGLHDLTVDLGRLTIFIGPNGVGKSSILEAVSLAGLLIADGLDNMRDNHQLSGRWEPAQIIRSGAAELRLELTVAQRELDVSINAQGILWAGARPSDAATIDQHFPELFLTELSGEEAETRRRNRQDALGGALRVSRLRLDAEAIAAPSALKAQPGLRHDGAGLPAFLQYLQGRRDGSFDRVEAAMRAIVPTFRQVIFEPTTWTVQETEFLNIDGQRVPRVVSREHNGVSLLVEFNDGAVVPATHVSEGTLLALALMTMVHGNHAQQPKVILIDDLERGLHPSAQHRLVEALKAVLAAAPDLQILATTHSPDLIDACDPADVRVLGRGPEGVVARALTEHPEADKWLKLLRVGEFWSTVGEDWVAGAPERGE